MDLLLLPLHNLEKTLNDALQHQIIQIFLKQQMSSTIKLVIILTITPLYLSALTTGDYTTLDATCTNSPTFKLNLCNISCISCTAQSNLKCTQCIIGFDLGLTGQCTYNSDSSTYHIINHLTDNIIQPTQVTNYKLVSQQSIFNQSHILKICQANIYHFQMLGLFGIKDIISTSQSFGKKISKYLIRFKVLVLVSNFQINVRVNDSTVYTKQLEELSELTGQYAQKSGSQSILVSPSINTDTANQIFRTIDIGIHDIETFGIFVEFFGTADGSGLTDEPIWAFSDFLIIALECNTCVDQQVMDLFDTIGTLVLIMMGILAVLIFILYFFVFMSSYLKKRKFQNKLGASGGSANLPIKGINRIIESIQKNRIQNQEKNKREMQNAKKYQEKTSKKNFSDRSKLHSEQHSRNELPIQNESNKKPHND